MIVTRTPFRISFFGGGSDYPDFSDVHGGAVLSTTIDKYAWITLRRLPRAFSHRVRMVYKTVEEVASVKDLFHPAARGILQRFGEHQDIELTYQGDLPARSGMGSSSAFTVGLTTAIAHMRHYGEWTKKKMAEDAIVTERSILRETVGQQDQVAAAYGGFNLIEFPKGGGFDVQPQHMSSAKADELQSHLMLVFTGVCRYASEVAASYVDHLDKHTETLKQLRYMAYLGNELLLAGKLDDFGVLLHKSWLLKRSLSPAVSDSRIDGLYNKALTAGAIGGKLLGAGGGGHMLFYAPPEKHVKIAAALSGTMWIPFAFEPEGCKVVCGGC